MKLQVKLQFYVRSVLFLLHNEKLHSCPSSPNVIRIVNSRRIRSAEHVARIGRRDIQIGFWWESQTEKGHQEGLDVSRRIIQMGIRM